MNHIIEQVILVAVAVFSSSGFWLIIQTRMDRKDEKTKMLLGLAHDRIISLGMEYIQRGWLTDDEFENINKYLYEPYSKLGGNGTGEIVMNKVKTLKIYKNYCDAQNAGEKMTGDYCARDL